MSPSRVSKLRQWALLVGGLTLLCTVLAGLSVLQGYVCDLGLDTRPDFGSVVRQEFKGWYALGLVSLGVLWFAGRNHFASNQTGRWLLKHCLAALLLSGVYAVFTSWLVAGERSVMHPGQILTFSYLMARYWVHYVLCYFLIYWVVLLGHFSWHHYKQFRQRETQAAQLQRELVEARLEALRMQLNPHFLFNTLHAISALIHENPSDADRVVARLSELLRLSLDQSKPQEVPLREEMSFLNSYLEIEQIRFAERLRIQREIGQDTNEALVPFLILQPLVENAIRHGIEPREELGIVKICARRRADRLELRVCDNGDGIGNNKAGIRDGIGLSNTRARLHHLYGENCRFELATGREGGLEAIVEIPFRSSGQAQAAQAAQQPPQAAALTALDA